MYQLSNSNTEMVQRLVTKDLKTVKMPAHIGANTVVKRGRVQRRARWRL